MSSDLKSRFENSVFDLTSGRQWLQRNKLQNQFISQTELWSKNPKEFNTWRKRNDLYFLYKYLEYYFPLFHIWLREFKLDEDFIFEFDRISDFFFVRCPIETFQVTGGTMNYEKKWVHFEEFQIIKKWNENHADRYDCLVHENKMIIPYFYWLQCCVGLQKIEVFVREGLIRSVSPEFNISLWKVRCDRTTAFLFSVIPLLSMGECAVRATDFRDRNLELLTLDNLNISGEGHSNLSLISFSSLRSIVVEDSGLNFLTLYNSIVDNLTIRNSDMQSLNIVNCNGRDLVFEHSRLSLLKIESSHLSFFRFSEMKLRDPIVIFSSYALGKLRCYLNAQKTRSFRAYSFKHLFYRGNAENILREIRTNFANCGDSVNASRFYYKERMARLHNEFYASLRNMQLLISRRSKKNWLGVPEMCESACA